MNDSHRAENVEVLPKGRDPGGDEVQLKADTSPVPPAKARRPLVKWIFGLAALLLLAAIAGFVAAQFYARARSTTVSEQKSNPVPTVQVAELHASDGTLKVSLPGTTLAFEAANIFARANGYIQKRAVDIGDHVKAGDLLAQITAPELDQQIAQAQGTLAQLRATLEQTQASRDLAQITRDRDIDLVKKGWLTPQQGDTDRLTLASQDAAISVAKSNIVAQEAMIRVLDQQKAYQSVIAPFDGIVTQRNVDNGSLVQAGSTFMFTLMQSNVIRVQVYVPQDAALGVAPGVDALVRIPEAPDRAVPGKVTRLAKALAPGTRTLLTEIDVPNADGFLSPGLYCTVELHIPRKTPSIIVPADAIIFNSDGLQVAVVENDVAHIRKITVVRDLGTEVEASAGVKPGDRVILKPMVDLVDGSKVLPQGPKTRISED